MQPQLTPGDDSRRARPSSPPTSRDQSLLTDAGRFGLLTFRQIKRRHFDLPGRKVSPQTVHRRLKRLRDARLLDRRIWGYGASGEHNAGYLPTARALRLVGLDVPVARNRDSVLAGLPHDATVVDVAEVVTREARRRAPAARVEWVTERELKAGPAWLPPAWGRDAVRPDGVLVVAYPDGEVERTAVEVDVTQHSARRLERKVGAYRRALAEGVYALVVWYCVPGGALAAVRRALAAHGDPERMAAAPIPPGADVYA